MGRTDRPKELGRFTTAGSLETPPNWTPRAGDEPSEVALAVVQRFLLHDVPDRLNVTPEDLARHMGVPSARSLEPYLNGSRALGSEHILRLMHAFDLGYADLPASSQPGSASLLPDAYKGMLRRDSVPGVARIVSDRGIIDWPTVTHHLSQRLRARTDAGLQRLTDASVVLLDLVEGLRDAAGLDPRLASRSLVHPGARITYHGAKELQIDVVQLDETATASESNAVVGILASATSADHVTVLLAGPIACERLHDRFPALQHLRSSGDTALLDDRDLERAQLGMVQATSIDMLVLASSTDASGLQVRLIASTKSHLS